MKKISLLLFLTLLFWSCDSVQNALHNFPSQSDSSGNTALSQTDIGNGLKAALQQGIDKQVQKLAAKNGFYNNKAVKIPLPKELQKVEKGLQSIGLGKLTDEGIKALNRAASDAVGRATPIFVKALQEMSIDDARSILLDGKGAATDYLRQKTANQLYKEFHPEINKSFSRVGADKIWNNVINRYNSIPLTQSVNPDLTDYVTAEALKGVYTMIEKEENHIRENATARTTDLLQRVFEMQDQ